MNFKIIFKFTIILLFHLWTAVKIGQCVKKFVPKTSISFGYLRKYTFQF
jgi:hypothetical protein